VRQWALEADCLKVKLCRKVEKRIETRKAWREPVMKTTEILVLIPPNSRELKMNLEQIVIIYR